MFQVHSKVIQLYMYICPLLLGSFPIQIITEYWVGFLVLCRMSLLVVYFIYSGVCVLTVGNSVRKRSVTPMRDECVYTHLSVCLCAAAVTFKLSSFIMEKAQLP